MGKIKKEKLNEVLNRIDKEYFIKFYHAPHMLSEICSEFNLNRSRCTQLIHLFDLHYSDKEKDLINKKIYECSKKGVKEKYGVDSIFETEEFKDKSKSTKLIRHGDENYNNRDKAKNTTLERYGVENAGQSEEIREKVKQTCLDRYGVENVYQADEIKDKIKNTMLERYGVESALKADYFLEKAKATNLERYGVEYAIQSECIKEKIKSNNIEKYGCEWTLELPEIRDKIKITNLNKYGSESILANSDIRKSIEITNLKKYGCKNVFESEEIKEKIKQTNLERYGVDNPAKSKEVKDKIKSTCLERYGVDNSLKADIVKEKIKNTNLERYGSKYAAQSDEILYKIKKTNLDKYGVPWACMRLEARSYSNDSKPNVEFAKILEENGLIFSKDHIDDTSFYSREFSIDGYSYDFKIGNSLIEINPSATHNSTWGIYKDNAKDKFYHRNKTLTAKENGYRCINVWDWDNKEKIISMLKDKNSIYARKCEIKIIDKDLENDFINSYHIQGYIKSKIALGLFYNNELIQIMTFGKPRYNKNYEYELLRLCTKFGYKVIGGSEKLFKYFINNYAPKSIISYCDNSKFNGEVYFKLGFELKNDNQPSKHWYNIQTKQHITDNLLRQRGFDQLFKTNYGKGTSNEELMLDHGFVEIYDSGQSTYTMELN